MKLAEKIASFFGNISPTAFVLIVIFLILFRLPLSQTILNLASIKVLGLEIKFQRPASRPAKPVVVPEEIPAHQSCDAR